MKPFDYCQHSNDAFLWTLSQAPCFLPSSSCLLVSVTQVWCRQNFLCLDSSIFQCSIGFLCQNCLRIVPTLFLQVQGHCFSYGCQLSSLTSLEFLKRNRLHHCNLGWVESGSDVHTESNEGCSISFALSTVQCYIFYSSIVFVNGSAIE